VYSLFQKHILEEPKKIYVPLCLVPMNGKREKQIFLQTGMAVFSSDTFCAKLVFCGTVSVTLVWQ